MEFKHIKELSFEFESVNILIRTTHDNLIAGGDEGKLHLFSKDLVRLKS